MGSVSRADHLRRPTTIPPRWTDRRPATHLRPCPDQDTAGIVGAPFPLWPCRSLTSLSRRRPVRARPGRAPSPAGRATPCAGFALPAFVARRGPVTRAMSRRALHHRPNGARSAARSSTPPPSPRSLTVGIAVLGGRDASLSRRGGSRIPPAAPASGSGGEPESGPRRRHMPGGMTDGSDLDGQSGPVGPSGRDYRMHRLQGDARGLGE
jgi:hypothetical protein